MRTYQHRLRYTGEPGNCDAKGAVSTTTHDLAQEDYIFSHLFYGNAVIHDTFHIPLQLAEFMVMSRKQSLGTYFGLVTEVLHHAPRNGKAVKSRCATANFIQDDQ